jgi:hypothetical protein
MMDWENIKIKTHDYISKKGKNYPKYEYSQAKMNKMNGAKE